MLLGKINVVFLKNKMETLVCKLEVTKFIKSSREGNKAFIVQRGSNSSSRHLEVAEYVVGGHRGLVVITGGQEGRGLKMFATELGKVVGFFGSSLGTGSDATSMVLCQFPWSSSWC